MSCDDGTCLDCGRELTGPDGTDCAHCDAKQAASDKRRAEHGNELAALRDEVKRLRDGVTGALEVLGPVVGGHGRIARAKDLLGAALAAPESSPAAVPAGNCGLCGAVILNRGVSCTRGCPADDGRGAPSTPRGEPDGK